MEIKIWQITYFRNIINNHLKPTSVKNIIYCYHFMQDKKNKIRFIYKNLSITVNNLIEKVYKIVLEL